MIQAVDFIQNRCCWIHKNLDGNLNAERSGAHLNHTEKLIRRYDVIHVLSAVLVKKQMGIAVGKL